MPESRYIAALDVLFPRGNKLFGDAGQHGEAQMPPWPSIAAGAIRSRMLADAGADFAAFAQGSPLRDASLRQAIGTPTAPGDFRIGWFSLARRGAGTVEPVFALPSDLYATEKDDRIAYLAPQPVPTRFKVSAASESLEYLGVLRHAQREKPLGGLWLTGSGLAVYLGGEALSKQAHTVRTSDLWKTDARIGIALDPDKRSAAEGRLYTTEAVALGRVERRDANLVSEDVGLVVTVHGAEGLVPKVGLVRFGGDGRGARLVECILTRPEPDWERIGKERRFRVILATPGLFERGWRPPDIEVDGVTAHLSAAAMSRAQVVSGWDIARWSRGEPGPKPALRAAPAGSVYWFEAMDADEHKLVAALRKLVEQGFGCLSGYPDQVRLTEGFNNAMIGNWAKD